MPELRNKFADKIGKGFYGIIKDPMENIEMVLAIVMLVVAVAVVTPQAGAVYGYLVAKIIFAALLAYPSLAIIYLKFKRTAKQYADMFKKRKRKLFGLSIAYTYIMVLSLIIQHPWPPHWIPYLGLACISWIAYFRLAP